MGISTLLLTYVSVDGTYLGDIFGCPNQSSS
jgi:hypothetical protein